MFLCSVVRSLQRQPAWYTHEGGASQSLQVELGVGGSWRRMSMKTAATLWQHISRSDLSRTNKRTPRNYRGQQKSPSVDSGWTTEGHWVTFAQPLVKGLVRNEVFLQDRDVSAAGGDEKTKIEEDFRRTHSLLGFAMFCPRPSSQSQLPKCPGLWMASPNSMTPKKRR